MSADSLSHLEFCLRRASGCVVCDVTRELGRESSAVPSQSTRPVSTLVCHAGGVHLTTRRADVSRRVIRFRSETRRLCRAGFFTHRANATCACCEYHPFVTYSTVLREVATHGTSHACHDAHTIRHTHREFVLVRVWCAGRRGRRVGRARHPGRAVDRAVPSRPGLHCVQTLQSAAGVTRVCPPFFTLFQHSLQGSSTEATRRRLTLPCAAPSERSRDELLSAHRLHCVRVRRKGADVPSENVKLRAIRLKLHPEMPRDVLGRDSEQIAERGADPLRCKYLVKM